MLSLRSISPYLLILALASLPVSLIACQIFLILFALLWILESTIKEKWQMAMGEPLLLGYTMLIAVHLGGIIYSDDLSNAWFNIEKKLALFALPFIFATSRPIDFGRIREGLLAYVAGCFAATILSVGSAALRYADGIKTQNFDPDSQALFLDLNQNHSSFWDMFSYIELASGIRSHPTFLALYLVFAVIILFHFSFYSYSASRWSPLLGLLSGSTAKQILVVALVLWFEVFIALLSSRIMIAGLTIVLLFAWIQAILKSTEPVRMPKWLILVFLFPCVVLWINPVSAYRVWQEPFTAVTYQPNHEGVYVYSTGIRKSLWQTGLYTVRNTNAFIGAGTGDVKASMKRVGDEHSQSNVINSNDPHNQFLYTQVGLGLIGLSALIFCLGYPVWQAWKQNNSLYLSFSLLFGILCLTESALEVQQGITFFALFSAIFSFQYLHNYILERS